MAAERGNVAVRAAGLREQLLKAETYICLLLLCKVLQPLDKLSRRLQSSSCSASEMMGAANATMDFLSVTRSNSDSEVADAIKAAESPALELTSPTMPRKRKPAKKFCGPADHHQPEGITEYLRVQFLQLFRQCTESSGKV